MASSHHSYNPLPNTQELEKAVLKLEEKAEQNEQKNQYSEQSIRARAIEKEQDTRQELARWFVVGFFTFMFLIIFGVPAYNFIVYSEIDSNDLRLDLNDLLLTYSSIVGPILGFVIGYYFKSKD